MNGKKVTTHGIKIYHSLEEVVDDCLEGDRISRSRSVDASSWGKMTPNDNALERWWAVRRAEIADKTGPRYVDDHLTEYTAFDIGQIEIADTGVDRDRTQGGRDRRQGGALRLKTGGSFWGNVLKRLFGK